MECKCELCWMPFAFDPKDREPVATGCFHSFCRGCMDELRQKEAGEGNAPVNKTKCPICQTDMEFENGEYKIRAYLVTPEKGQGEDGEEPKQLSPDEYKKNLEKYGITQEMVDKIAEKVQEMERSKEAMRKNRDEVIKSARVAENEMNAFFAEIEAHRETLLGQIRKEKKRTGQQLNDVRTTAKVLRQGAESVRLAIKKARETQAEEDIDRALKMGNQLEQHLKASENLDIEAHSVEFHFVPAPHNLEEWKKECTIKVTYLDEEDGEGGEGN